MLSLVAYHSCAEIEADVRGLGEALAAEFKPGDPQLTDALLYCDMTTGPAGDYVRPAERLVEIRAGPPGCRGAGGSNLAAADRLGVNRKTVSKGGRACGGLRGY